MEDYSDCNLRFLSGSVRISLILVATRNCYVTIWKLPFIAQVRNIQITMHVLQFNINRCYKL